MFLFFLEDHMCILFKKYHQKKPATLNWIQLICRIQYIWFTSIVVQRETVITHYFQKRAPTHQQTDWAATFPPKRP